MASTPQPFARPSASDANWHTHRAREGESKTVDNTGKGTTTFEPPNTACSSASTTQVPCRNASGHLWLTPNSAKGSDSAVTAQNSHVHNSVTSPLPATRGMSGSTEPVTAYLQRINDAVCAAGPLPVAGEWAPIFWGLDQAWLTAHKEALTTQTFLSTLSTFMMVKGQVRPSSTEAQYVRDIARNVAKVRLGLMLDKGPRYGLGKDGGTQASTAAGGTQAPESTADPLQPADWPPLTWPSSTWSRPIGMTTTLSARHSSGPRGPCRQGALTLQAGPSVADLRGRPASTLRPPTFLQVTPLPDLGRSAAFRTTARYPATVAADGLTVCATEVRPADMFTFLRLAVLRTHAISPLCGRFRAFCRARPASQSEPSCLMPAVSRYSQVPDVGLGHSRRWRKIPRLLRSAILHMPLRSVHSRSGPPTCWQRRSYEVSNRTGRAPRMRPGKHVTLPLTSCCQRSKCKTLHMMRPPPPFKVIGQPSQTGWPRPGKRTANAGAFSGSPFPPDQRQIALGQVHTAAPPCSTLPIRDAKASHLLSDLEQELSSTVFQHVRAPCLKPCTGPRGCTHNQRLPAHTGAITSQRLFVVFHTAYPRGDSAKEAMPSPSAKLKSSRRLPKHLRESGAPPSGAIAQAREEAEARYNRGESSRRGQHSSVQGRRTGTETGDQWQAQTWHNGWYASYQQEGWYTSSACSSADNWREWSSSAALTSWWRPQFKADLQQI